MTSNKKFIKNLEKEIPSGIYTLKHEIEPFRKLIVLHQKIKYSNENSKIKFT